MSWFGSALIHCEEQILCKFIVLLGENFCICLHSVYLFGTFIIWMGSSCCCYPFFPIFLLLILFYFLESFRILFCIPTCHVFIPTTIFFIFFKSTLSVFIFIKILFLVLSISFCSYFISAISYVSEILMTDFLFIFMGFF